MPPFLLCTEVFRSRLHKDKSLRRCETTLRCKTWHYLLTGNSLECPSRGTREREELDFCKASRDGDCPAEARDKRRRTRGWSYGRGVGMQKLCNTQSSSCAGRNPELFSWKKVQHFLFLAKNKPEMNRRIFTSLPPFQVTNKMTWPDQ